jgi:hypothetical protein
MIAEALPSIKRLSFISARHWEERSDEANPVAGMVNFNLPKTTNSSWRSSERFAKLIAERY